MERIVLHAPGFHRRLHRRRGHGQVEEAHAGDECLEFSRHDQSGLNAANSRPLGSAKWNRRPPGKPKIGRVITPPAFSTAACAASRSSTWITTSGALVASLALP